MLQNGCGDGDSDHDLDDLRYEAQQVAVQEQRLVEKRRLIEASFGVGGPSADRTQPPKERQFVPVKAEGLTAEMAKRFLPPNCRLYKDVVRENRWRLWSAVLGAERSKSFGKRSRGQRLGCDAAPSSAGMAGGVPPLWCRMPLHI